MIYYTLSADNFYTWFVGIVFVVKIEERLFIQTEVNTSVKQPLRELVRRALEHYFAHLDQTMPPRQVYPLVLEEVEIPLLEATLAYTNGNQCQAADILGISRSTLRKKLRGYQVSKT